MMKNVIENIVALVVGFLLYLGFLWLAWKSGMEL